MLLFAKYLRPLQMSAPLLNGDRVQAVAFVAVLRRIRLYTRGELLFFTRPSLEEAGASMHHPRTVVITHKSNRTESVRNKTFTS